MDLNLVVAGASLLLNAIVIGFWKPWLGAYGGEKGKTLARKEDLDAILAEVRAVTITQKEIEAKLSGDLWDRQMKWNQKRDIYGDLLRSLQDIAQLYGEIANAVKMQNDVRPDFKAMGNKNVTLCFVNIKDVQALFGRATILAHIFTMPETFKAILDFMNTRVNPTMPPTAEWAMTESSRCSTLVSTLAKLAKKDLGIDAI
jgi:hypothetical protein